jgi:hypothetical protein
MGAVRAAVSATLLICLTSGGVALSAATGSGLPTDSAPSQRQLSEAQVRRLGDEARVRTRELQWPSDPLYPENPYSYVPPQPQYDHSNDDTYYYGKGATYPGKGKGSYPVEPPVGKGGVAPPTWLPPPPPGKGGGSWPSKSKKGSKGGYLPPPPNGKGKGWVPPPPLYDDDYYLGGKGSVVPPSDDLTGKGKGGPYPVPLPTYGKGKGSYPVGKGKGLYPVGKGKGIVLPPKGSKGGSYPLYPPADDDYGVLGCKFPWDGASPIPGDMWLGTRMTLLHSSRCDCSQQVSFFSHKYTADMSSHRPAPLSALSPACGSSASHSSDCTTSEIAPAPTNSDKEAGIETNFSKASYIPSYTPNGRNSYNYPAEHGATLAGHCHIGAIRVGLYRGPGAFGAHNLLPNTNNSNAVAVRNHFNFVSVRNGHYCRACAIGSHIPRPHYNDPVAVRNQFDFGSIRTFQ